MFAKVRTDSCDSLPMWTSSAADDLSVVGSLIRTAFRPLMNSSPRLMTLYLHSYLFFLSACLFPLFAHVVSWSLRFGSSCGTLQGRSASAASFPATSETPLLLWWSMTSPVSQSLALSVSRAQLAQFSC